MKRIHVVTMVFIVCLNSLTVAQAGLINFESIPGVGSPTEGLAINTQYLSTEGVAFSLEGGGDPVMAMVGAPETAFTPNDTPLSGQGLGQFFLTDDGVVIGNPAPLIVSYTTPTAAASGVIVDIDGLPTGFPEIYTIQARDIIDAILEEIVITAGDPGTGNQVATDWAFNRSTIDIYSIRISTFREGNRNVGLAFDNFNTRFASIPEPSVLFLFILGFTVLLLISRRTHHPYSLFKQLY